MHYHLLSDSADIKKTIDTSSEVKVSDIIKISQAISGDWLEKEAQKKVSSSREFNDQKEKAKKK